MHDAVSVWFITGCSTGFGQALARSVIDHGWRAVVTARDRRRVDELAQMAPDRVLALDLDVTNATQITTVVAAATDRFGRIDVLVNNAGFGYMSSVEEGEEDQIRAMFDANVFGLFALTRAVLPHMREQRRGHVINISSVAGFVGLLGSGYYSATKHAVEGFSKALALEVASLGIRVSCIEPGVFRTDFHGRSIHVTEPAIADYAETVGKRFKEGRGIDGKQPGDPVRAAEAIIAIAQKVQPPRHLVLGRVAFEGVTRALRSQLEEIEARRETSLGADYPTA